ncbi:MAG: hypothetical protein U0V72_12645 [Cytophagales bacterium]
MKKTVIVAIVVISVVFACKKEPGPGGNASILGNVNVRDYNSSFSTLISTYKGSDEYVYLIYGNNISYGQRIKTNYDGAFEFKYLRTGKYMVYVYSKDSTLKAPNGKVTVLKEVEIHHKNEKYDVGTLTIFK